MGTTTPANVEKYIGKFDRAVWDSDKHDTGYRDQRTETDQNRRKVLVGEQERIGELELDV